MPNLNKTLLALSLALGAVLLVTPSTAIADKTSKRIASKTAKAMEEYDMMEFEAAKSLLLEAIAAGEKNGGEGPELAAAYLSLGIVYYSGLGDEEEAAESFSNAIRVDSGVALGVAYGTPEMNALLEEARSQGEGGGEGAGDCAVDGIDHQLVDEAARGSAPEILATLGSGVKSSDVYVFFRSEGELEFTKAKLKKKGECQYVGNIPTRAVHGDFVHYYVAAVNSSGKEVERKGSSGSPNIIEVAAASGGSVRSGENPLGSSDEGSLLDDASGGASVFVSLAVGSGTGYITGPTEKAGAPVECCMAPALLHVMPEIGYYIDRQLSVSAAFRMGFPVGANVEGHATFAPAGLLRARYAISPSGTGVQVSGAIGGGIIRNTVQIKNAVDNMNTDTTAMGPLLLGAGVGYLMSLGGPMRLVAEVNALAALTAGFTELGSCPGDGCVTPKNGAEFDANLAILFAF